MLRAIEKDRRYVAGELGVPFGDPYVLGTPDPDSRPYHPTRLTREFKSFCKMNGFEMTFHDLRHTFASMMIAGGTDVRITVNGDTYGIYSLMEDQTITIDEDGVVHERE